MKNNLREVRNYQTFSGNVPFKDWLFSLKDARVRAMIYARIDRLRQGNFGDYRNLGEGVNELRVHYGPGYRIYFSQLDNIIIVLLCGGIKKSQSQDIKKAKEFWQDLKNLNL